MFPSIANEEEYYWDLTLKDGRVVHIPPKGVPVVQRKMQAREPVVTNTMTIPFSEIKGFEKSSRKKVDVPLLEEVAQAFNEPMFTEEGAIKARWVKKEVTRGEYERQYAKSPSYKYLSGEEGMVQVAFVLAVHQIDLNKVQYCTREEEKLLTK